MSQANQRQAISEIELTRLATFFAAEGSVSITGKPWPTLYVAIGNTEKLWVEQYPKLFGGSMYVEQPKYIGAKAMFRWRLSGPAAVRFLELILPHLMGEKVAQGILGIKFQAFKEANQPMHGGRYLKMPSSVIEQLGAFHQEMKMLRCAAAETNRKDAASGRSDSPILEETLVYTIGKSSAPREFV